MEMERRKKQGGLREGRKSGKREVIERKETKTTRITRSTGIIKITKTTRIVTGRRTETTDPALAAAAESEDAKGLGDCAV